MAFTSLILLNAGPGLSKKPDQRDLLVEWAARYAEKLHTDGDNVAVMVAGSEGKSLPFDLEGYENISVVHDFGYASPPQTVIRTLPKLGFDCDYINAILAAIEVILLQKSPIKVAKRIVVFIGENECIIDDSDDIFSMILDKLKAEKIVLDLCMQTNMDELKDKANNYVHKLIDLSKKSNGSMYTDASHLGTKAAEVSKIPAVKDENSNQPESFTGDADPNSTGGHGTSSSTPIPRVPLQEELTVPQLRSTSTRVYLNGTLNITSKLIIPISCFVKTSIHKPASFGKVKRLRGGQAGYKYLIQRTTRVLENNPFTEVQDSETAFAYEYGGKLLSTDGVDASLLRVDMAKGLYCKGFVRLEAIQRHWYSRGSVYVAHPKGNRQAAYMMNALFTALESNHRGILVHFLYRQTSAPTLCVLTPHKSAEGSFLVMNQIPYAEDLRKIRVCDLSKSTNQPTEAQLTAADKLISAMMLHKENEIESVGVFCPEDIPNPALDRIAQCIMERVSKSDGEIPKLSCEIEKLINHSEDFTKQVSAVWSDFYRSFPISHVCDDDTVERNARDEEEHYEENQSSSITTSSIFNSFLNRGSSQVDIANPVLSFWSFIRRRDEDFVLPALEQMQSAIKRIVRESQGAQFFGVAGNCMEALRDACVQYQEGEIFNNFLLDLRQWKAECGQAMEFWNSVVVKRDIIPIHQIEWPESAYTLQGATQFHDKEKVSDADAMVDGSAFGGDLSDLLDLVV